MKVLRLKFLSFAYTLTNAFLEVILEVRRVFWGDVSFGDRVPYIPQNQCNFSLGLFIHRIDLILISDIMVLLILKHQIME